MNPTKYAIDIYNKCIEDEFGEDFNPVRLQEKLDVINGALSKAMSFREKRTGHPNHKHNSNSGNDLAIAHLVACERRVQAISDRHRGEDVSALLKKIDRCLELDVKNINEYYASCGVKDPLPIKEWHKRSNDVNCKRSGNNNAKCKRSDYDDKEYVLGVSEGFVYEFFRLHKAIDLEIERYYKSPVPFDLENKIGLLKRASIARQVVSKSLTRMRSTGVFTPVIIDLGPELD